MHIPWIFVLLLSGSADFEETFDGPLAERGWTWLREDRAGWRLVDGSLEIRTKGSLWESKNNQRNVLLRKLDAGSERGVAVEVSVNAGLGLDQRYEHGGLIWYLDDDNWVTLTQLNHVADGTQKVMLVHEDGGRGRAGDSVATPYPAPQVDLRLVVEGTLFTGYYRAGAGESWRELGSLRFAAASPRSRNSPPRVGLVAGDGLDAVEHWVAFDDFHVSFGR